MIDGSPLFLHAASWPKCVSVRFVCLFACCFPPPFPLFCFWLYFFFLISQSFKTVLARGRPGYIAVFKAKYGTFVFKTTNKQEGFQLANQGNRSDIEARFGRAHRTLAEKEARYIGRCRLRIAIYEPVDFKKTSKKHAKPGPLA